MEEYRRWEDNIKMDLKEIDKKYKHPVHEYSEIILHEGKVPGIEPGNDVTTDSSNWTR